MARRTFALQDNPAATLRIGRKTFDSIEKFIKDNEYSIQKVNMGMDVLVRYVVLVVKAGVQQRSMGPIAPRRRSQPGLAYRIPVQRITGRYFAGWHTRRLSNAVWLLYNDSYESYLIETGMFQRVRRPILKMSILGMLKFMQHSRTGDRFVDWIIAPRRDSAGKFVAFNRRVTTSFGVTDQNPQDFR